MSRTSGPPIFDTPSLSSIRTHFARAISTQNRYPEAARDCNLFILLGEMGPHFLRTEKMVPSRRTQKKGKALGPPEVPNSKVRTSVSPLQEFQVCRRSLLHIHTNESHSHHTLYIQETEVHPREGQQDGKPSVQDW